MEEEASTLAELYRRLEMVRENRIAVQISYHVQETHSCHRNRLVNQMRELDQMRPQVKADQILVQLGLDQHQLEILKVINKDLDPDQQVMVKLHQDLKVVQILRPNRNNLDQDQAT